MVQPRAVGPNWWWWKFCGNCKGAESAIITSFSVSFFLCLFCNVTHCTPLGPLFAASFLHGDEKEHACVQRCLSHSCSVRPNLHRTPERWTKKADGPSPSTFVCVSLFLFSPLFLITAPKSLSAGQRLWPTLFSIGPGWFPGRFSGDDECSSLSSTLFRSQTVYSFQSPVNYPFSGNNHLN